MSLLQPVGEVLLLLPLLFSVAPPYHHPLVPPIVHCSGCSVVTRPSASSAPSPLQQHFTFVIAVVKVVCGEERSKKKKKKKKDCRGRNWGCSLPRRGEAKMAAEGAAAAVPLFFAEGMEAANYLHLRKTKKDNDDGDDIS